VFSQLRLVGGLMKALLSWNGFNVYGDSKTVKEVHRLLYLADRLAFFEKEIKEGRIIYKNTAKVKSKHK